MVVSTCEIIQDSPERKEKGKLLFKLQVIQWDTSSSNALFFQKKKRDLITLIPYGRFVELVVL